VVEYDYVLHLGQAPGSASVQFEAIALNVAQSRADADGEFRRLVDAGPVAYRSTLPLHKWSAMLRDKGIPTKVSFHAGTFLCNAVLYYSLHTIAKRDLKTQATFVHLPLDITQASVGENNVASMPAATTASAVRSIVESLA